MSFLHYVAFALALFLIYLMGVYVVFYFLLKRLLEPIVRLRQRVGQVIDMILG
jgi:hypothetical protein